MNKFLREKFKQIISKKIINELKYDGDPDSPIVIPPEYIRPNPRHGLYYNTDYPNANPIFNPKRGNIDRIVYDPQAPSVWRGRRAKWSPVKNPPRPPLPPDSMGPF